MSSPIDTPITVHGARTLLAKTRGCTEGEIRFAHSGGEIKPRCRNFFAFEISDAGSATLWRVYDNGDISKIP